MPTLPSPARRRSPQQAGRQRRAAVGCSGRGGGRMDGRDNVAGVSIMAIMFRSLRPCAQYAGLSILLLFLCICFLCGCRNPRAQHEQLVQAAIRQLTPLTQALDAYEIRAGKYPHSLQELVASGDLTGLPRCADMGRREAKLVYRTDPLQTFYYLTVAYEYYTWGYRLYFVSFQKTWQTTKYPPKMEDLVALGMGLRYRHSPSTSNLTLAVNALLSIGKATGSSPTIYRSLVTNALGSGVPVPLPTSLGVVDQSGDQYEVTNQAGPAYVVHYREISRKPVLLTKDGVLGNTQEVDAIYDVRGHAGDAQEKWSLLRQF
jgi:hypothetical protein